MTNQQPARFSRSQRILHWLMAVMVTAMLFIGVTMVSTVGPAYLTLVDIHKPLGISILALVLVRLVVRWRTGAPPLPRETPPAQAAAARLSHWVLYALLLLMPLIGWGMLSAGGYPIVLWGPLHLPPILLHDDALYALLQRCHVVLAYLLFAVVLTHFAAALFHALVRRDGVFESMTGLGAESGRGS